MAGHSRVGTRFADRYHIEREIGRGGMGTVYEARQVFMDTRVALKILHAQELDARAGARFLREARATAKLGHPSIVEILDAGVYDGTPYLAFERLDGEDLGAALERRAIDADRLIAIVLEVLDALAAAHAEGFVHRDIKPENVFLVADGTVRLLDFGIARAATVDETVTGTGAVLGTPLYMSPEQARGKKAGPASDIYSLGALMFHALSGAPPFVADNYNLLVVEIITKRAPALADARGDLPAELTAIVDRALEPEEAARWPSATAMADALRRCRAPGKRRLPAIETAETLPASVPSPPTPAAASEPPARARAVWFAGAAVLVAALAVAGWSMSSRGSEIAEPEGAPRPTERAVEPAAIEPRDEDRTQPRIEIPAGPEAPDAPDAPAPPADEPRRVEPRVDRPGGRPAAPTVPEPDRPETEPPPGQAPSTAAPPSCADDPSQPRCRPAREPADRYAPVRDFPGAP